eukprot:2402192-Rhodomonas_salina.1
MALRHGPPRLLCAVRYRDSVPPLALALFFSSLPTPRLFFSSLSDPPVRALQARSSSTVAPTLRPTASR